MEIQDSSRMMSSGFIGISRGASYGSVNMVKKPTFGFRKPISHYRYVASQEKYSYRMTESVRSLPFCALNVTVCVDTHFKTLSRICDVTFDQKVYCEPPCNMSRCPDWERRYQLCKKYFALPIVHH
jgi:hypothetical protein